VSSSAKIVLASLLVLAVGVGAFMLGSGNNNDKGGLMTPTPTPIVTVTTSLIPPTTLPVTPTATSTPLPTVTATPTPTPTIGYVTKKIKVDIKNASPAKVEFTIEIPSTTTVSVGKNEIFLRNGSKTYMWLYSPYEYYTKATYTSKVAITSSTIENLFRVTTKQDLGNSFHIAYATSGMFISAGCEDAEFGVAPPCLTPAVKVTSGAFMANCSVQSQYIPVCDRIMKTISVKIDAL